MLSLIAILSYYVNFEGENLQSPLPIQFVFISTYDYVACEKLKLLYISFKQKFQIESVYVGRALIAS